MSPIFKHKSCLKSSNKKDSMNEDMNGINPKIPKALRSSCPCINKVGRVKSQGKLNGTKPHIYEVGLKGQF